MAGPQGTLTRPLPGAITVRQEDSALLVERPDDQRQNRALHGLTRSLVANMVTGVTAGFSKDLEIVGVGYRAIARGPAALELALGFSHPVTVDAPEGVIFEVPTPTRIVVKGIDKEKVGQVAADIRKLRKPEPYKGKGIRYAGERVDSQGRQGGQVAMATAASTQADPSHPAPCPGAQARRGHHGPPPAGRVPVGRHISAQVIDDTAGRTLAAASTVEAALRGATGGNVAAATAVGKLVADRAKSAGVTTVVFDRGGFRYHGRVAALADAAREGGLEF